MTESRMKISDRILYFPLGLLLGFIGMLPLPVSSLIGRGVSWVARYVVRYRLRLVRANVGICFPELPEKDRNRITDRFYHRLGQYMAETLHTPWMNRKEMMKRMAFSGTEIIDSLFAEGKDIVIYTAHFGNWEWIPSVGLWCKERNAEYSFVYRPLKNQWFDAFFLRLRSGMATAVKMRSTLRSLVKWRSSGIHFICGFLSDQKPSHSSSTVDVEFFGRKIPFLVGTEEIARKMKTAVCYFDTELEGNGYYRSEIKLITDDAGSMPEGEITRRYVEMLENTIRRAPEAYLWSHNRWRLNKKTLRSR